MQLASRCLDIVSVFATTRSSGEVYDSMAQIQGFKQVLQAGTAHCIVIHGTVVLQVAGWTIVCGFSAFFALVALFLVWVDVRFAGHKYNSEQFNTAGRSVKAGLIGVDVVSHFTWASILLGCVSLSYLNGISNSMW